MVLEGERGQELRDHARVIIGDLSRRQAAVLALYCYGRRRPVIAPQVRATERTVKRDLERAMSVARHTLVAAVGGGCAAGEALVGRHAFGLAAEADARAVQFAPA